MKILSGHSHPSGVDALRLWEFDAGQWNLLSTFDGAPFASWWHRGDGLMWSVEESSEGALWTYAWDEQNLKLEVLSRQVLNLADPCHLLPWSGGIALAHYTAGAVSWISGSSQSTLFFQGSGADSVRQDGPHPHFLIKAEAWGELWCADLGADRIWRIALEQGHLVQRGEFVLKPGFGPRHMAWLSSGHLALTGELADQWAKLDPRTGEVQYFQAPSCAPGQNYPSHLIADEQGKLWIAGRGHQVLQCFDAPSGQFLEEWELGVDFPRHFCRAGNCMILAGQKDGKAEIWHQGRCLGQRLIGDSPLWVHCLED